MGVAAAERGTIWRGGRPLALGLVVSLAAHWLFARALPPRAPSPSADHASTPSVDPATSLAAAEALGPQAGLPHDVADLERGGSTAAAN
ncbi:MAG: hypothetical protein K1X94_21330, partial [Sandaracinaceae bacterium]|nr:hypothetical protein [Sandaracinaceae bacterium]